jgi:hypothetical protein
VRQLSVCDNLVYCQHRLGKRFTAVVRIALALLGALLGPAAEADGIAPCAGEMDFLEVVPAFSQKRSPKFG